MLRALKEGRVPDVHHLDPLGPSLNRALDLTAHPCVHPSPQDEVYHLPWGQGQDPDQYQDR